MTREPASLCNLQGTGFWQTSPAPSPHCTSSCWPTPLPPTPSKLPGCHPTAFICGSGFRRDFQAECTSKTAPVLPGAASWSMHPVSTVTQFWVLEILLYHSFSFCFVCCFSVVCMSVLPACISICTHTWCPQRAEEGIRSLGTTSCEAPSGFWEPDLGPLPELPVLLIFKQCL